MRSFFPSHSSSEVSIVELTTQYRSSEAAGGTLLLSGTCQAVAQIVTMLRSADQERVRSTETLSTKTQTLSHETAVLRHTVKDLEQCLQALEKEQKGK
jgi:hypothetical protein